MPRERTASTYLKFSPLNSPGPALTWPHSTAILRNSSTQPHLSRTSTVGEVLPRSGSRGVTAARPRDTAPLALTTCALARSINSVVVPKVDGREEGPCLGGRLSLPPLVHDAWSSAVPGPRGARGLREGGPRGRVARAARTRSALPPQARGLTEGAVSAIVSIRISPCDLCVT